MYPCNPHLSENIKYFHHPITFLDGSKLNSNPTKTGLLCVLSQTTSLDSLQKRLWAPTVRSVYINNCFPASCITDAKPHQAQMQEISMVMPTREQARCNWVIQPQHLALFSCLLPSKLCIFILQFPLGRRDWGTEGWLVPKSTGI